MISESNENSDKSVNEQSSVNQEAKPQEAKEMSKIDLKKRELLKTFAKGAFLVPATLLVLTNKAAAASGPTF